MRLIKRLMIAVLLLLVLAFGVLFSVQNTATAPLDLLLIQLSERSVTLWVFSAFALGGVLGMLVSMLALVRLKSALLMMQRKLKKSELELGKLRTSDLRTRPKTLAARASNKS